jgi:hypothetical protein
MKSDTAPEIEALMRAQFAALPASERARMALEMFETAQVIVLSSLPPNLSQAERRRELCRRFYGDQLADRVFPRQP